MVVATCRWLVIVCGLAGLCSTSVAQDAAPRTGPETEQRFPPLKVPVGFKVTLFACDPLVEYPSAIALGPRPGSIFMAADYMTGLGTEIVRRDEIRLVEDTDGDGYADRAPVFADGFNSIMGLTFHRGTVYVMHSPFLTAVRDTDGDGKADERRDLLRGLGLTPEDNPVRLHCANGIVAGHDGWLYLALGDHGCRVKRPEGDELVLNGGGILRCRADGRDLHVFATGLRNIYDVALDDELNVFVRDNENDGGDYKIRVCHSFFGADHGYPYLYYERPDEALPPIADLGLGSSAGGVCYLERQFPAEYRGNLIFCEWGRSVVRYRPQRSGAGFGTVQEIEFAAGAENDPYGFKPTDVIVERDGSLIVADWADGQRPKRGRCRIYRIQYVGAGGAATAPMPNAKAGGHQEISDADRSLDSWINQLNSLSYYERVEAQDVIASRGGEGIKLLRAAMDQPERLSVRARRHAVWILAGDGSRSSCEMLFNLVRCDGNSSVQAQAVRALADLVDPVLIQHRLDAEPGDQETAVRLARLVTANNPLVLREVIVALGRMRCSQALDWLVQFIASSTMRVSLSSDPTLAHAAMQALRRSGNWSTTIQLLDFPTTNTFRTIALRAVANQAVPEVVDSLVERLGDRDPARRLEYAEALTRVHRKPGEWVYWGYRPPPRPANSVEWERTKAIEQALDRSLCDRDPAVRVAVLRRMQREKIPTRLATLDAWLIADRDATRVAAVLDSLREHPADQTRDPLLRVVGDAGHASPNRLTVLTMLARDLDEANSGRLLDLARRVEEGPVLADVLRSLIRWPRLDSASLIIAKLDSSVPEVRAAALEAAAELRIAAAAEPARRLLDDGDVSVRRAAAAAMGRLAVRSAVETLLRLGADDDAGVRRAVLDSLRQLHEPRVISIAEAALADRQTQLAALDCLEELGGPKQSRAVIEVARRDPSPDLVTRAVRCLSKWSRHGERTESAGSELVQAVAELQGQSGLVVRWAVLGPVADGEAARTTERMLAGDRSGSQAVFAQGIEARIALPGEATGDRAWLASADVAVAASMPVQFLAGSGGKLSVWVNGRRVHHRDTARAFAADSDRFDATLNAGANRIVVQVASAGKGAEMHLRFRRKSSAADIEALVQAALARPGNAERGRTVFFDTAKSQCSKCHRIGDLGERIGPELTGVGSRFSRIHIVESILEPSRTVTPGFQTLTLALRDGRVLSGIKVSETETTLVLGDNQGQKHILAKTDIEEQKAQPQSTMPDGLTKPLTVDQFVDLVAFLVGQKEIPAR